MAALGVTSARTEDPKSAAEEAIKAIAAAEATAVAGRLTLAIQERRGQQKEGEKTPDARKRIAGEEPLAANGSFIYGPDGWLKELAVPSSARNPTATRTRTAEAGGILQMLLEATVRGEAQSLGRISRATATAPGDALLAHRVAKTVHGMQWLSTRTEGEMLTLEGSRNNERHVLVLSKMPRLQVKSWQLVRTIAAPAGGRLEQVYSCEVTRGETPAGITRIEEWVENPAPSAGMAYRVTEVKKAEPLAQLKPDELVVRFPRGTVVLDARPDPPVEYEVTDAAITAEDAAQAAQAIAQGRALAGEPAPPVDFKDLKGKPIRLQDYRGKILLLFWFNSRSRYAQQGAQLIGGAEEVYGKKGVRFLGLSVAEEGDAAKKAEAFRKEFKWSFPVGIDPVGEGMRRYGPEAGVPKVAIVDPSGTLAYVQAGIDVAGIKAALDRLTEKPSDKPAKKN
jgi:peroxiredoxin